VIIPIKTDRELKTIRLDLMLDIFQNGGRTNLARGTPQIRADVVVPGQCDGGFPLCQMRALPHLPKGTTAMADRRQLTTGTVARFS
jgi:hypothetical protein